MDFLAKRKSKKRQNEDNEISMKKFPKHDAAHVDVERTISPLPDSKPNGDEEIVRISVAPSQYGVRVAQASLQLWTKNQLIMAYAL